MMQDVHVKSHPGFPWQKQHLTTRSLYRQIGLGFKEGTSKMLRLENSFANAETLTLKEVDQTYIESFEMEIRWTEYMNVKKRYVATNKRGI
jgi:hypothetical protein